MSYPWLLKVIAGAKWLPCKVRYNGVYLDGYVRPFVVMKNGVLTLGYAMVHELPGWMVLNDEDAGYRWVVSVANRARIEKGKAVTLREAANQAWKCVMLNFHVE